MPNVKITKYVQIIYIIFSLILFISFFILPSIGLKLRIDKFGCDGCSSFNNFLVFLIALAAWSIFYGAFYVFLFSKDIRNEKTLNPAKLSLKYTQKSIREKSFQTIVLWVVMIMGCLLILRFFLFQISNFFQKFHHSHNNRKTKESKEIKLFFKVKI